MSGAISTKALAKILEADLLRGPIQKSNESARCFTCGRPHVYKGPYGDSGRFCSAHCREGFDAGAPRWDPDYTSKENPRWYRLPIGPRGFYINCFGCGRRFDSIGVRCCSTKCEREYREREERERLLADIPFRAEKRKCAECGGDIPNWRNGRRVSSAVKFCSPRCGRKHARKPELAPSSPSRVLVRETAKKCPKNGPSRRAP